ncbi:MAG: hypothetical protein EOP45_16220, partial [Sphingobacteriaceae bacterium]
MQMPQRHGRLFSPSFKGSVNIELGSYSLDSQEMETGQESEQLIILDGIGEFAISDQVFQQVQQQSGSENLTPTEYALAILGKALELGCKKVRSAPK